MRHLSYLSAVVAVSIGIVPLAFGVGQKADQNAADQNAQVTIGGAKASLTGEILKIDGEYYFVKDDDAGSEVRLLVNRDSNLDCSAASIAKGTSTTDPQPAEKTTGQQETQTQKKDQTAIGSGFSIGTCSFKPGDRIKAEVDDMGRVTTLKFMRMRAEPQVARSLGEGGGTGELAIPGKQEKSGQLDMTGPQGYPPKEYAMLPVPLGELKSVTENPYLHSPVKNAEGRVIGTIDSLFMDSHTGQIEYAVVLLDDSKRLEPVSWAHMKKGPDQTKPEFVLDTKTVQLSPSLAETKDLSPQVDKLVEERRAILRSENRSAKATISKIEVLMQNRGFQVTGHSVPDSLTAVVLRNQDTETHGFSSPFFKDLVIRTEGDVIEVKNKGIRSYHVPPGKTVTLYFTSKPSQVDPATGIRETAQYAFQCDIHPNMKGEFLVLETRGEMGGG